MSHARTPGSDIANGSLASSPARRRLARGDLEDDGSIGCADVSTVCGIRDRSPLPLLRPRSSNDHRPARPQESAHPAREPNLHFSACSAYPRRRRSNQAARKVRQTQLSGTPSLSVINRRVERQHSGSYQCGACATVHRALEGLQTIDLPLSLAVAPPLGQRVCDGVDISPHRSNEALHGVESRLLRVIEPGAKFLNVFASENTPESHCEPTHGCEIWRRTLQSVNLGRLTPRQQPTRLDA